MAFAEMLCLLWVPDTQPDYCVWEKQINYPIHSSQSIYSAV